jgi:predicted HicB family RNase H-like nuclease
MKRTDMAKKDAEKLRSERHAKDSAFGGAAAPALDRREQRERDRALGLVPFAVKLNGELVQQLQALAKERGADLNTLVAELLQKGLAD